jgi:hypothetical protein
VATDGQLGLQDYFQFEGKAFRVVPKKRPNTGQFGYIDPEVHAKRLSNFRFTEWNNPDVYFDENIRRMLTNYRYGFTQLADTYMREGDLEKAAEWLLFGEEKIPFRAIENDWRMPVLYAYRFLRVNENESALDVAELSSDQLKHKLNYDFIDLNNMEREAAEIDESAQRARANANMADYQTYQRQLNKLSNSRQNLIEEVSFTVSLLTILQHIYYECDEPSKAEALTADVNQITQGRLQLPESAEASSEEVNRFGLGI